MFEELKELSHLPKQIFWEDACAYWIGESNEVIEARRLWVIKALKAGKISKPSTLRTWTAAVAA